MEHLTTQTLENAFHVSKFIAELTSDDGAHMTNQKSITTGLLAVAVLSRYFEEDKQRMLEVFSVLLDACDHLPNLNGEDDEL